MSEKMRYTQWHSELLERRRMPFTPRRGQPGSGFLQKWKSVGGARRSAPLDADPKREVECARSVLQFAQTDQLIHDIAITTPVALQENMSKENLLELKQRRLSAMNAAFGILKGKAILPQDGLEFEREMREH